MLDGELYEKLREFFIIMARTELECTGLTQECFTKIMSDAALVSEQEQAGDRQCARSFCLAQCASVLGVPCTIRFLCLECKPQENGRVRGTFIECAQCQLCFRSSGGPKE